MSAPQEIEPTEFLDTSSRVINPNISKQIVMDRDGWSGKSLIINILLPFHICV